MNTLNQILLTIFLIITTVCNSVGLVERFFIYHQVSEQQKKQQEQATLQSLMNEIESLKKGKGK